MANDNPHLIVKRKKQQPPVQNHERSRMWYAWPVPGGFSFKSNDAVGPAGSTATLSEEDFWKEFDLVEDHRQS